MLLLENRKRKGLIRPRARQSFYRAVCALKWFSLCARITPGVAARTHTTGPEPARTTRRLRCACSIYLYLSVYLSIHLFGCLSLTQKMLDVCERFGKQTRERERKRERERERSARPFFGLIFLCA